MTEPKKRHLLTPRIWSDAPPLQAEPHAFHFDEFAVTLARLIASKETRTPLTVGVSGPWGSGKTTLLRRMRSLLRDTEDWNRANQQRAPRFWSDDEAPDKLFRVCRTVWFDAWKYNGEDQLCAALLRVIVDEMQGSSFWNQIKGRLNEPRDTDIHWLRVFLHGLTQIAGKLTFDEDTGVNLGDFETDTPLKGAAAFYDYFDDHLNRLLSSWIEGKLIGSTGERFGAGGQDDDRQIKIDETKGVMVVFIDDLDRCLPAKTVQVLEATKLFLDKPGCIFVLGADTDVVQKAVVQHYENAGVTGDNARDYLEKIIQINFEIPPILPPDMRGHIEHFPLAADEEIRRNWETIVTGAEMNLRKVKTSINDLNLRWAMLQNSGQAEGANRDDFIRWQVLMRAAPGGFVKQIRDLDDKDLQRKFIGDAQRWAQSKEGVPEFFKDYEKFPHLKRLLREAAFTDGFTSDALSAFQTLTALPAPPKKATVTPVTHPLNELEVGKPTVGKRPSKAAAAPPLPEAEVLTDVRKFGGIPFVPVPKGKFVMGSKEDNPQAGDNEKPQSVLEIPYDYWISRFPITNARFAEFVKAPASDVKMRPNWEKEADHPIVEITWDKAIDYCKWLNQVHGAELGELQFRLPTEAEWEKAARGEYGNEWPWGNEFDAGKCNTYEGKVGDTTPVGSFSPRGDSPYGVADMAGNVWEWCQSLYKPYPYNPEDGRENLEDRDSRVLRGGSFFFPDFARCSSRYWFDPDDRDGYVGFRVVLSPSKL